MPRYIVTKSAGPYIAGQRNPGAGKFLDLTERQAAHELRLGSLAATMDGATRAGVQPSNREDATPAHGLTERANTDLLPGNSAPSGERRARR